MPRGFPEGHGHRYNWLMHNHKRNRKILLRLSASVALRETFFVFEKLWSFWEIVSFVSFLKRAREQRKSAWTSYDWFWYYYSWPEKVERDFKAIMHVAHWCMQYQTFDTQRELTLLIYNQYNQKPSRIVCSKNNFTFKISRFFFQWLVLNAVRIFSDRGTVTAGDNAVLLSSGDRRPFPYLLFNGRLINASLYLFAFKWQGKSL